METQTAPHAATGQTGLLARASANPYVSVVLPVYQEQDAIRALVDDLVDVLSGAGSAFEVIAVDDGSRDGTLRVLEELSRQYPAVLRVVSHPYNKGNGSAIKTGIRAARGEVIACMDADGQHAPRDLLSLLPQMARYDLVVGARTHLYKGAWHRTVANRVFNGLASWLTAFQVEDLTSGYRVFRGSIVKRHVSLFPSRFSYPTTSTLIFLKGGYNVRYEPISVTPRRTGASKIRAVRDGWRFLLIIFKIVVLFEPLKLFLPVAAFSFILATISASYSTWRMHSLRIPNSSVILFLVGVLVVLLGFMSEQLAAIHVSLHEDSKDE